MKTNIYNELKGKISELNKINDEINLIEWNKDDGPKFTSVEEMKEFENKVNNGELDYIFDEETTNTKGEMLKTEEITKDDYLFYIYTYKRKNEFITYLTIKDLKSNEILQNVCGNVSNNKDDELSYNKSLTNDIKNNTIDHIFNKIITDIDKNISELKKKYEELTNAS